MLDQDGRSMHTITRADQLASHNGDKVRVVGIYRRWIEEDKQGHAYSFTGFAVVELERGGSVQIGEAHRARQEVERCVGRRVAVTGVLDTERREEERPDPLPILRRPDPIELV
jgi:hypothetical protein